MTIIIGEIRSFDIGPRDVLAYIQDEYGQWHKCIGDTRIFASAIRFLSKNKDKVKITGDLREREIYHTPGVQQEVLIISLIEQIMEAHEDFNFRLTGALY